MNNNYLKCFDVVKNVINEYCLANDKQISELESSTRLIGSSSPFDSSDLVQIIVEIEDNINDIFNTNITLTDEKAMSRSTSPFVNIETLTKFIVENLSSNNV